MSNYSFLKFTKSYFLMLIVMGIVGVGSFSACKKNNSSSPFEIYNYDGEKTLTKYTGNETNVVIPDGITEIGDDAFKDNTNITNITIPNSVTKISTHAFEGCTGLTSITIPNSVTNIDQFAFNGCTGLTSATIGNSVKRIESSAFKGCLGLTSITIPNSVTNIEQYAFYRCTGLTSIIIPNSVTKIGNQALAFCTGLTSITIGSGLTSIGDFYFKNGVFLGCTKIETLNLDMPVIISFFMGYCFLSDKWSDEEQNALTQKNLKNITIGNHVTSIEDYAFQGCTGLTNLTIGNSVKSIGDNVFAFCTGLTSITIPNSVTNIGKEAFAFCTGITSITIECTTPPKLHRYPFDGPSLKIKVPNASLEAYNTESTWSYYASSNQIIGY